MQMTDPASKQNIFRREFWILWGAGVVSAAVAALISGLPVTPVADRLFLANVLSRGGRLDVIEGAEIILETGIIVAVGLLAARSLGLGAPFLERWLRGERISVQCSSLLIPALVIGVLAGAIPSLRDLPVLHPNRREVARQAERILSSTDRAKLSQRIEKTTGQRVTPAEEALFDLFGAISGAIELLFSVSVTAWCIAKFSRRRFGELGRGVVWATIVLSAAGGTIIYLARVSAGNDFILRSLRDLGIPMDPRWSIIVRGLLATVPGGIGFAWLYIRKGLESTVIASLVAQFVGYMFAIHVIPRFY